MNSQKLFPKVQDITGTACIPRSAIKVIFLQVNETDKKADSGIIQASPTLVKGEVSIKKANEWTVIVGGGEGLQIIAAQGVAPSRASALEAGKVAYDKVLADLEH